MVTLPAFTSWSCRAEIRCTYATAMAPTAISRHAEPTNSSNGLAGMVQDELKPRPSIRLAAQPESERDRKSRHDRRAHHDHVREVEDAPAANAISQWRLPNASDRR